MNNPAELRLFIEPWILRHTGRKLLEEFFARFAHLLPSKHSLPTTPQEMAYYTFLADLLQRRRHELPEALVQALYDVEGLAAAENWPMPDVPEESAPTDHEPYRLFKGIHRWLEVNDGKIQGTEGNPPEILPQSGTKQIPKDGNGENGETKQGDILPTIEAGAAQEGEGKGSAMAGKGATAGAALNVETTGGEGEGVGTASLATVVATAPAPAAAGNEGNNGAMEQNALPEATPSSAPSARATSAKESLSGGQPVCPRGPADEPPIADENPAQKAPAVETDEEAFGRLARLSPAEYDRVRHKEAHRLRLRIRSLDAEIAVRRSDLAADAQANAVDLQVVKPWPEPITNFADVLHQVLDRYERYLWLPPGAAVALTLWTPHADMYTAFHHTPRLILLSDEPGCGKTTTFEVLASMVQKPLRSESMTPAVLFRVVDQHQPTLLLDELDTYLHLEDELPGLVVPHLGGLGRTVSSHLHPQRNLAILSRSLLRQRAARPITP